MDENRPLSGEEQRARMKEQYKRELLEQKQLMQRVKQQQQKNKLGAIVEKIENLLLPDDTDEWIEKLNQKSAIAEAKFDMAVEARATTLPPDGSLTLPPTENAAAPPTDAAQNNIIDIAPTRLKKTLGEMEF